MPKESKDAKAIKVLLLEDEATLANLYSKKLTERGFQVRTHSDANGVIEEFDDFEPDIAFLDYSLHGNDKSGIDIIPLLLKKRPDMKIVMLSNYSEFQMEQQAKEAGAVDYLLKINTSPMTLADYTEKLAKKFKR